VASLSPSTSARGSIVLTGNLDDPHTRQQFTRLVSTSVVEQRRGLIAIAEQWGTSTNTTIVLR